MGAADREERDYLRGAATDKVGSQKPKCWRREQEVVCEVSSSVTILRAQSNKGAPSCVVSGWAAAVTHSRRPAPSKAPAAVFCLCNYYITANQRFTPTVYFFSLVTTRKAELFFVSRLLDERVIQLRATPPQPPARERPRFAFPSTTHSHATPLD